MKKFFSLLLAAILCLPLAQGAIKVHTIGDSTMAEYDESTTDKRGWGMYLGSFFDSEYVTVNNRGKSGSDSRGFYTGAAYWPSLKTQMNAGDYLLIQFAHNDEGTVTYGMDNLEYAAYCASHSLSAPSDARGTNPQTTFREYLRKFIDEARAMGVNPVLVGPICRAYFQGNDIRRNGQHDLGDKFSKIENDVLYENQSLPAGDSTMSYVKAMKVVAAEKNVPFIDLTEESRKIYLSYGETACLEQLFCEGDKTHTNAMGGNLIAREAAQLLKNAGVLAEYINIPTDISANPDRFDLGEVYCTVAQNKEFLLTGYGLEPEDGSVALRATANLQLSLDKTNYAATANATYTGGSMFQKVYLRANYTTGGEQNDTVYVTSGEHVTAIPVSATAISLDGGVAVSATWAIDAKPMPAPVVDGPVTAAFSMKNMAYIDLDPSKRNYFVDGNDTVTLARFHNSENGSSRTPWPAGEIDENADRYLDFAMTAPNSMDIRITTIAMEITADATTTMCYHINTGFGDNFTSVTTIAEKQNMSNRTIEHVNITPTLTIPAGKTLHVRILPWHNAAEAKDSKYIALRNVVIAGQAFEAEEQPGEEPGEEPGGDPSDLLVWTVGNEEAPVITSEKSAYIKQAKVLVGSGLTVGNNSSYTANPGNNMVTYLPASSNAGNIPDVMIEYAVSMVKGTTFTLQNVSYDAIKEGTDNASYSWSYVVDGVESDITTVSKDELLRNNNANVQTARLNHSHAIEATGKNISVRFYVSGFGNTKKFALSNVQISGVISGEPEVRSFKDFQVEFRDNPYTILLPENGELPAGVTISGTSYNGGQHGVQGGTIVVPVDGPVKFTVGACQYSGGEIAVKKNGEAFAVFSNKAACGEQKPNYNQFVTWTYNVEEDATLTFEIPSNAYVPYFFAEACEYIAQVEVKYYDVDGKTLIGKETVDGGSALAFAYGASDVTVAEGMAFRGWFASAEPTALKVAEGTALTKDISLYARTSEIEVAKVGAIYDYDLKRVYFYPEDHELLLFNGGKYHGAQHGWVFSNGNTMSVDVAGDALLVVGVCRYSATDTTEVKDAAGNVVGQLDVVNNSTEDGSEQTIRYTGDATTLTFYFTATNYIHSLKVYNVESLPVKNEATGFFEITSGDAAAFILTLQTAEPGDKIFLPNGVYDMGETVLTQIAKNNISIIGESMEGTIIKNAPDFRNEGIATTATILIPNNIENTYMQDLTLQNALDYYGAIDAGQGGGRAVVLQDKGTKTICKNVKLLSYQDTYYSNKPGAVKYFADCEIHGTVDFICGDGSVYFENNLLFAEKRNRNGSGSDALTAANNPSTDKGYVFANCTIQSECPSVSLGRAWNGKPSVAFINTLVDYSAGEFAFEGNGIQRWTKDLMNSGAWPLFGEFNTHLENGTVLTPNSNVVTFEDKKVNPNETREIETVLTADQAAAYTMEYTLGDWAETAAADAKQAVADPAAIQADAAYLIEDKGNYVAIVKGSELNTETYKGKTIRQANARGGFGVAVEIPSETTAVENVSGNDVQCTKILRNGMLLIEHNGKTYNVLGAEVR